MKIGSIVIHCYEFDCMVAFWQKALGYLPREPASADWVVLRDSARQGSKLVLSGARAAPGQTKLAASRPLHK